MLILAALLTGCVGGGVDLSTNAFVGRWDCDGVPLTMSDASVTIADEPRQIAFVERGGNADFGITATDGERYSIFNTEKRSLTFVIHAERETLECRRLG